MGKIMALCPLHKGPDIECRWDVTKDNAAFLDHLSKTGGQAIVDAFNQIKEYKRNLPPDVAALRHPAFAVLDQYPLEIEVYDDEP